jgi:hypothetical protein
MNNEDPKPFQDSSHHHLYPKGCIHEADLTKSHIRRRSLFEGSHIVIKDQATYFCSYFWEKSSRKIFV